MRSLLLLSRRLARLTKPATHLVSTPDGNYLLSSSELVTPSQTTIPLPVHSEIINAQYLNDSHSICVIYKTGEIVMVNLEEETVEEVGALEEGVKEARWGTDEESLVLVSGTDNLVLMTRTFDVLSEAPLQTEDYGEDKPIALGWGQKATQFHGSLGKQAAQASPSPVVETSSSLTDLQEDGRTRVAWRGDGDFFAVSSLEKGRRKIRVYSRAAALMSTAEDVSGMGSAFDWQPSGSLLASVQYSADQTDEDKVIFFERNGLRRYDFALRNFVGGERQKTVEERILNNASDKDDDSPRRRRSFAVRELRWNADSTVLAVWMVEDGENHSVQLWKRNNYHWYLQQELKPKSRLLNMVWHPEEPLQLYLLNEDGMEDIQLVWDTYSVKGQCAPNDTGAVAVVDGTSLLLTPFRLQNVPPPMSSIKLSTSTSTTPAHCILVPTGDKLNLYIGVLFSDGLVKVYEWEMEAEPGRASKIKQPVLKTTFDISSGRPDFHSAIQIALSVQDRSLRIGVLFTGEGRTQAVVAAISLVDEWKPSELNYQEASDAKVLLASKTGLHYETSTGAIRSLEPLDNTSFSFPTFCSWLLPLPSVQQLLGVGLSGSGRLYLGAQKLADDCSSFEVTEQFLLWTTFSNRLKVLRLPGDQSNVSLDGVEDVDLEKKNKGQTITNGDSNLSDRFVERGSRIVTVVASTMTVVLQMPRGNLETISPRPLVLEIVKNRIDEKKYREAYLACRKNRIDLNLICDHNPQVFLDDVAQVVDQVNDVDMLNVLLSSLSETNACNTKYADGVQRHELSGKINAICDTVRRYMETKDQSRFVQCILTAYVCRSPPDYEGALRKILTLQGDEVDDAVKYIIFLSDTNELYDLALGMYEFKLVTLIAQQSNKDPREYLPFLRGLRQLEPQVAKFRIDDHLGRYEKALENLVRAGPAHLEEVLKYTKTHNLFQQALKMYRDQPDPWRAVLCAYGQHLVETDNLYDGAVVLRQSGQDREAMEAYRSACAWREFFELALSLNEPAESVKEAAEDMAETLKDRQLYNDAAVVLLDHAQDVKGAIEVLAAGQQWSEALRLVAKHGRSEMLEGCIVPEMSQVRDRILDDIGEMDVQFTTQSSRLDALAGIRRTDPDAFFDRSELVFVDDGNVQADAESEWGGTQFTRYTVAPTTIATSRRSKHSSKTASSRRKNKLKQMAGGRKGTVSEEEYILSSIVKLLQTRLKIAQDETRSLLVSFLRLRQDQEAMAEARELQDRLDTFERKIGEVVPAVWPQITDEYPDSAKVHKEQPVLNFGGWKLPFL
ncbi:IkappaB kinase complex, IKAP component [Atractiella rhizophila]|nr:IkappaB kinase complex, IKAP component [Atractiella rhizophila]